jgi:REP element-mobilizing transposase RayT
MKIIHIRAYFLFRSIIPSRVFACETLRRVKKLAVKSVTIKMTVRKTIFERQGVFFITFTCTNWLNLFSITESYDLVYKWFDYLISKNHQIAGYVIMPNHLHVIIAINNSSQALNTVVSNGKRFMAYEIVARLEKQKK